MLRSVDMSKACADELPGGQCLRLASNSSVLCADLELLAQAADGSIEVRQRLLDFLDSGAEFVRVDRKALSACPAGQLRVEFELADGLRLLVLAVRAGEFDGLAVEHSGHGHPSRK